MTPVILLEALKVKTETALKCLSLPVKDGDRRPPKVYLMQLPSKKAEETQVPYVVLQFVTGKDQDPKGEPAYSDCKIRIIAATYADDAGVGALDVLNVLTRLRIELLKSGVVADQFLLLKPLEYIVYPYNTGFYHLGEMMTTWEIPSIEREVNF